VAGHSDSNRTFYVLTWF